MVILSDEILREFGGKILENAGASREEASWVAECLVESNLKGVDSHGVRLIPWYVKSIKDGPLRPGAKLEKLKDRKSTGLYDGNFGFGYTIARDVMDETIEKAKETGAAYSGVVNSHHIGRVGKWVEMALEEDMVGVASQPGGVYIAPWGGLDRKLPIAPVAIAMPTEKYKPVVIDISLGPISGGRTSILAQRGQKVPLGWFVDDEGKLTDDPKVFDDGKGAQLPLGGKELGYKGMALSMVIDAFTGPLFGLKEEAEEEGEEKSHEPLKRRGIFLSAIDIEAFTSVERFKESMDYIIDDMKSSKMAEGFDEIMYPGEPEWRELEKREKEGIFIDDGIYQDVLETAEDLGIDTSKYKGKSGKLEISHPSYTLKQGYETHQEEG